MTNTTWKSLALAPSWSCTAAERLQRGRADVGAVGVAEEDRAPLAVQDALVDRRPFWSTSWNGPPMAALPVGRRRPGSPAAPAAGSGRRRHRPASTRQAAMKTMRKRPTAMAPRLSLRSVRSRCIGRSMALAQRPDRPRARRAAAERAARRRSQWRSGAGAARPAARAHPGAAALAGASSGRSPRWLVAAFVLGFPLPLSCLHRRHRRRRLAERLSLTSGACAGQHRRQDWEAALQLGFDMLQLAALLCLTGGV